MGGGKIAIVTNPPYAIALPFILHALELCRKDDLVCMFVKTTFLEGKKRYKELFSQQPPRIVLQFVERILCAKNGDFEEARKQGSAVSYCWMIWTKGYKGSTIIDWIANDFISNYVTMKILELFSGTECLSNAFRERGHECFTVDWDKQFPSSLHIDIMDLTSEMVYDLFGPPDIIWGGFDCTTFSVAAIGRHRTKNYETGSLDPKTEKAARADEVNMHSLQLIHQLNPHFFFIENPMGGLRCMDYMQGIPRHLITYCQYGFKYRKATDIFTNHPCPGFKPPCKNGDPCHEPAPRGTRQGLQAIQNRALRSAYPEELCRHIVDICEKYKDVPALPYTFGRRYTQLSLF